MSPVLCYDPVGRVVATLHPNHTGTKVVFDPWRQETWDVNDTVLTADPGDRPGRRRPLLARLPDAELPAGLARGRGPAARWRSCSEQAARAGGGSRGDTRRRPTWTPWPGRSWPSSTIGAGAGDVTADAPATLDIEGNQLASRRRRGASSSGRRATTCGAGY